MPRIPGKTSTTVAVEDPIVPDIATNDIAQVILDGDVAVTTPVEIDIVVPDLELQKIAGQTADFGSHLVSVAAIYPSEDNPRTDLELDDDFVASIAEHGILQPLVVEPIPMVEGELAQSYTLIAGHRRYAAAEQLGWRAVPVVVRDAANPGSTEILRLVENLQRRDLNPVDEARAYERLVKTHGMSQAEVAEQVGRNQGHVSKRLKMLTIGRDGLGMVVDGRLTLDEAVSVARMPAGVRADVLDRIERGQVAETVIEDVTLKLADLAERGQVLKDLKKAGTPFVDLGAGGTVPEGARQHYARSDNHEECPNRLVVVTANKTWSWDGRKVWTAEYCTDEQGHDQASAAARQRQLDADTADGTVGDTEADRPVPQWKLEQDERDALEKTRSEAVATMLAGKLPKGAAEFIAQATIAAAQWAHNGGEIMVPSPPKEWLDVVVPGIAEGASWVAAHGDVATRLALATWCAAGDYELAELVGYAQRHGHSNDADHLCRDLAALYAARLTASGYELHPLEQAALGLPNGLVDGDSPAGTPSDSSADAPVEDM